MGEVDPRVKEQQRQRHKEVGSVDANLILIMIITMAIKKERQRQGKYLRYMQYSIAVPIVPTEYQWPYVTVVLVTWGKYMYPVGDCHVHSSGNLVKFLGKHVFDEWLMLMYIFVNLGTRALPETVWQ